MVLTLGTHAPVRSILSQHSSSLNYTKPPSGCKPLQHEGPPDNADGPSCFRMLSRFTLRRLPMPADGLQEEVAVAVQLALADAVDAQQGFGVGGALGGHL